jgi:hypothetical protein
MVLRDITYKRQLESLIVRNFGSAAVKGRQKLKNALGLLSTFRANSIAVDTDPAEMVHELEELLLSGYRDLEVPFTVEKSGHDFYSTENGISLQDFFRTHGESFNKEIREEFGCNVGWQIDNNLPKAGVDRTTFRRLIIHLLKCVAPRCKSKQEVRLSVREMGDLIWVEGSVRRQEDSRESAFLSAHPVGRGELLDRSEIELAALRMVVDQAHGQVWIHPLGDGGDAVTFCLPAAS